MLNASIHGRLIPPHQYRCRPLRHEHQHQHQHQQQHQHHHQLRCRCRHHHHHLLLHLILLLVYLYDHRHAHHHSCISSASTCLSPYFLSFYLFLVLLPISSSLFSFSLSTFLSPFSLADFFFVNERWLDNHMNLSFARPLWTNRESFIHAEFAVTVRGHLLVQHFLQTFLARNKPGVNETCFDHS